MIESPIANDSITNKQATKKESIYHTCRSVLNALEYVDGFDKFMVDINNQDIAATDPLTKLWHICKDGSSLCYLYNTLKPDTPITVSKNNSSAANKSKACVYHFIIACRDQLHFPEDTLFTVTELFQNDTNGFVKVVNTVKRILDLLEEQGIIHVDTLTESTCLTFESPKDMRDNVVFELLSTERKYVQDLESLQNYMREVSAQEILSQDTMHFLFGNLNALVDFQRRFLIQIEDQAAHPSKEQRFGLLFKQFEEAFSVYEPFCANFQIAQDLVIQESHKLQKLANIMSPTYELPSMLIKPIQRVCKYPLLLQQLIKATPEDWPHCKENKSGLEAIQRVTKKVNETKRLQENQLVVQDLKKRIVDDTTSNSAIIVESAGSLLLHDKFTLQRHDNDHSREMLVFLFQKVILICKEIKDVNKNAITIKKKRKEGSLVLRGKILLSRIEHVKGSSSQNGHYTLHLSWMEGDAQNILLKCRNDEQLRQWLGVIIELKESTTKVDLISAPQTPRMETNNPLLHYDEDEEDYYDGELSLNNSEDEENASANSPLFMRNRSYSYQHHRYPNEVSSRKASLSNNSTVRHFMNGVPGMTLPPLPRSPTNVPTPSNASVSTVHSTDSALYSPSNLSFPSSPPTSYPPSPTSNNNINNNSTTHNTNGILPSGALWQRRQQQQQQQQQQDNDDATVISSSSSQSHHVRARSQSSPNIQRPIHYHNTAPELPTLNNIIQESKRKSNGYRYELPIAPATPSPLLSNQQDITKVKVHYFGAIYVVVVPTDIEFEELQRRIESKIKLCGQEFETSVLGLKYEDEDGDLITISSSEDVQMGFENKGPNNAVNLYVTS
ncbi:hypothetical protein HMPREF1544_00003 [Mucor circinelloides 1006PhL]|uniref:DH domain-containing protein n=1 Tax=Mucor circinelloides f. circinelloides (strain 1006PhL) TaxID=1220926 RepID=S2JSL7_MUCC1|nr:hypothetical protein HMPREF1544_00003 [Mucor circinelloides 1006PhL]